MSKPKLVAERTSDRHYTVKPAGWSPGDPCHHLCFRDVAALAAARAGLITARERCRYTYGFVDVDIVAECAVWGIGDFTCSDLQRVGLLSKPTKPGRVSLTPTGRAVLDAIAKLPGVALGKVVA